MDVFELRERLVADYRRYARSFLPVKDERIRERLHRELDSGLLWPDPPVQLNPAFAAGGTVADLVGEGLLHEECERIFRVGKDPGEVGGDGEGGGRTMLLHRHQAEAIRESARDRSYVLTTGTGSGKSLAYIVPAVDHALHSGARDGRLKTLIVYPMNALANSQMGELEKFLRHGYPEGGGPVSYARYTGQESDEEREAILASPPDILLTNYVMLEYILTRPRDRRLIQNAGDLRYLVLDELHTYRGRQGADVGLLARRVRAACGSESLRMVGTSATLAGSGSFRQQREEVATVASRIFGTPVLAESVIGETLRPATAEADLDDPEFKRALRARVEAGGAPEGLADLVADPLARWIERTLGIRWSEEDRRLERQQPLPISGGGGASEKLAAATGVAADACEAALRETLLAGARTQRSDLPFPVFAFRLHQFLSGGATFWASLDGEQERHISSSGQQFVPGDKERVLLPLCFCRECGQEYYCVRETGEAGGTFVPRQISDHSVEEDDRDGFLYLSSSDPWPSDVEGVLDRVPPDWLDPDSNSIRKSQRRYLPSAVAVNRSGVRDPAGVEAAFLTAPFRFCLACGVAYGARLRSDFSKLASLGAGGRSTSTDILGLSTLDYLRGVEDMEKSRRKILSFTDNRQDASLQAGHFNDFVEVSLLRSALYKAAAAAGPEGLDYTQVAPRTLAQTGLTPAEYAAAPELKGGARAQRDSAMHEVVAYRIYADQMRWRLTSPNLEQAGLIELGYAHLDECVADEEEFGRDLPEWFTGEERAAHPALADADPATRREVARVLLDFMRRELALSADQLDRTHQEGMAANSRQHLTDPWVIEEHEELSYAAVLFPRPRRQGNDSRTGVFLSPRGAFGSFLRRNGTFPHLAEPLDLEGAAAVIAGLLAALRAYGLVSVAAEPEEDGDVPGFQLQVSELRWIAGDGTAAFRDQLRIPTASSAGARTNPFFVELYRSLAGSTGAHVSGREHTAQVPAEIRAEREAEFRSGDLPLLFCSPTMELGVDIADLNVVNLRNVPPTPANYAQRSGRAGRGGDPALVYTYCSSWSNHDRYFFRRSNLMVSGKVSPPALDLGNEDLLRAHVHAIWLAETGAGLGGSMTEVLDTDGTEPTLAVREHLAAQLRNAAAAARAKRRAAAIFATLADDLATADWYDEGWLDRTLDLALDAFDRACERWRELFRAARAALDANHQVTLDASASRRSKQDAQRLYREAVSQLDLLGATPGDTYQSDFYPYRYFAGEGFLPGYNFPRLPLSAFIPARRRKGNADDFLSRPRFLAIAEFGPRSVIYHEGSRYIVNRVILPAAEQEGVPLSRAKSCPDCGYLHEILDGDGLDLCERCHADLGAATGNLLRLQNVTTRRRDRISSNEEERQRQGYDLRTSVRFDGHSFRAGDVRGAGGDELAELQYGGAATIWRINLGWSRRADKAVQGFGLDMKSGFWQRNDQLAETDPEDPISAARVKRVIPYVEDRRNALLFDPRRGVLGEAAMATLEAALKQGIQAVFQLEDSELAAEPLPERGDRRLLLFYEASEGGAGALRRLFEADRVAAVAREALSICHFDPETGADLGAVDRDEPCEAGCYDCLLSYSNQRDHRLIDRHLVRDFLLALAGAGTEVRASERGTSERVDELKARCDSELERRFLDLLVEQGRRLPTHAQKLISEERARPDFTYVGEHLPVAVFVDGPHHEDGFVAAEDAQTRARLEDAGYQVVAFPHDRDWPEILDRHPSIFGAAGGGG